MWRKPHVFELHCLVPMLSSLHLQELQPVCLTSDLSSTPFTGCVTWGKLFNLSSLHLEKIRHCTFLMHGTVVGIQ